MTTIYHNNRCSKSRQTLALLEENGIIPEVILYLDNPPTQAALQSLMAQLGINDAREMMRTNEEQYKALNLSDSQLTQAELLDAITQTPKLLQRPIVVKGDKAVIGRPPENVLSLL